MRAEDRERSETARAWLALGRARLISGQHERAEAALQRVTELSEGARAAEAQYRIGETRQQADLGDMTWNAAEIIAQLSRHYRLAPGDLIYTGTPAGVGAIAVGDRLEGKVADLPPLRIAIGPPEDEAAVAERVLADPA